MPGTCLHVKGILDMGHDLYQIHIEETKPPFPLVESSISPASAVNVSILKPPGIIAYLLIRLSTYIKTNTLSIRYYI